MNVEWCRHCKEASPQHAADCPVLAGAKRGTKAPEPYQEHADIGLIGGTLVGILSKMQSRIEALEREVRHLREGESHD